MLPQTVKYKVVPKSPNKEVRNKVEVQDNLVQQIIRRKLGLFGHFCRMNDNRLVKSAAFEMMEGNNREEDQKENGWMTYRNGVCLWGGGAVADICRDALNRIKWEKCVDKAVNTNGQ